MTTETTPWEMEYDNDSSDEGFWEWWTVTNDDKSFKCSNEADAKWLCDLLNAQSGAAHAKN